MDHTTCRNNTIAEATKLSLNNKLFVLRHVSLLLIAPSFLLLLLHSLIVGPQMQKVEEGYETDSSLDQKDVRALVALEIPFFIVFSAVWLFGTATTIVVAASAYSDNGAGNKSLSDLKGLICIWIKSTSKKVACTWLYASLVIITYAVLSLASFAMAETIFGSNNSIGAVAFTWVSVSVAALIYPHLASICALGLVISVLEENRGGARAFEEAQRLVSGRKTQTYIIMLFLTLLSLPIYVLLYVTSADDDDQLSLTTGLPFMLVATALFSLANFFTFVVFTLFYFETKRSYGEKVQIQVGPGYCLVPCSPDVDATSA